MAISIAYTQANISDKKAVHVNGDLWRPLESIPREICKMTYYQGNFYLLLILLGGYQIVICRQRAQGGGGRIFPLIIFITISFYIK